ncbi:hypothetical protein MPDQ_003272 [Monascus purpureus]|uniref:C6 transcription factor n=1 Tax=Monascus purpureus TaxID=5098 RepID=A0A507R372_MONPU|nr:hypothetical protein MPDQ_003272 [Monascus purpureus]
MGPTHATATNYYVQALHGLRTAISSYSTGTGLFPEEPILTIALLCKYEIVRGSVKQWASHLDALQKIIMSCGGFGALNRDTAEYLRGLMVYCGHMAKITNRGNKDTAKDALIYDPGILNIPTKLDIYVGYTEEILKIFARIADLYSLESDLEALDLEIFSINESLRIWTHTAKEYIIPKGMTQSNLSRLKMVADCFRDAAYIFLHSTLERMSQQQQPESDSKAATLAHLSSTWACLAYLSKSEAVHRCLHRVGSSSLDSHCEYSALTFPLFIAGCESEIPVERELVMRSLDKLEENFGIGNVKRAKELLQTFWGRQGEQRQHWMDALEQLRWELILA